MDEWNSISEKMDEMKLTPSRRRIAMGTARFPCFSSTWISNLKSRRSGFFGKKKDSRIKKKTVILLLGNKNNNTITSLAAVTSLSLCSPLPWFRSFLSIRLSPSCESKLSIFLNIEPLEKVCWWDPYRHQRQGRQHQQQRQQRCWWQEAAWGLCVLMRSLSDSNSHSPLVPRVPYLFIWNQVFVYIFVDKI